MSDEADPGLDTTSADTAVADSPSPDASTGGASAAESSSQEANPAENGSLADSAEVKNQDDAAKARPEVQQPAVQKEGADDWKKRHDGQFQANQRLSREKKELESRVAEFQQQLQSFQQQFQGVDPRAVQEWKQQQEKASLPVWNPKHPEHEGFRNVLNKYQFFNELYDGQTNPEIREALKTQFYATVSQADRQRIAQFEEHGRQEKLRLQMDPQGYIQNQVKSLVQQEINSFRENTVRSYQETMNAQQELQSLQKQFPEMNTLENLQKIASLVQQGIPTATAFHATRADVLAAQISQARTSKASADEKERLLTGRATISRDPAVTPKVNIWDEAEKIRKSRNIPSGDARMMKIFDELRRKHNIKE